MKKEEKLLVMAFTGVTTLPFDEFQEWVEKLKNFFSKKKKTSS